MKTARLIFKEHYVPRLTKAFEGLKAKVEGKPTHYQLIFEDDELIGVSAMNGATELGFISLKDSAAGLTGSGWHSSKQHGSVSFRVDLQ
jgi:hypothetical protein